MKNCLKLILKSVNDVRGLEHLEMKLRQQAEESEKLLKNANDVLDKISQQRADLLLLIAEQLKNNQRALSEQKESNPRKKLIDSNKEFIQKSVDFAEVIDWEQGGAKLNLAPQLMNEIVKTAVDLVKAEANKRGITFELTFSKVPWEISLDKEKISLVLAKILDNALKYSQNGGRLEVRVHNDYEGMKMWIKDFGIGFSESEYDNLWKKFYRSPSAVVINPEGVGLNLYWCRKVIEAHGGKFSFNSRGPNEGAEFGFWVPFKRE